MSNVPSRNPAGDDSLTGLLKFVFKKFLQNTETSLPATVIAYSPSENRAQLQPAIVQITTGGAQVPRGQLASVPVLQLGGSAAVHYDPVGPGCKGWIIACDRDISLFKKTYKQSAPNTLRLHSFSDSWFVPDTMLNGVTIAEEDVTNSVWQNLLGTVRLALWPTLFKFTTPTVGIGDTAGYTPAAHLLLDLQSTQRAFAMPRMTTVQKEAIPSPENGWMVWDTTEKAISTWVDGSWS